MNTSMVDFSIFFLMLRFVCDYARDNVRINLPITIGILFAVLLITSWVSYLRTKAQKDYKAEEKKKSSSLFDKLFTGFSRFVFVLLVIALVVYVWPLAVNIVVQNFSIDAHHFNIYSVGILIALLCIGVFLASRFFPNVPSNNSLCNTRQVLTWTSYLTIIIFVFFALYNINFVLFRRIIIVIFFLTETMSLVFWFYDPMIYIASQIFQRHPKTPYEPTPDKLNRFAVIGCAHNEEMVIDQLIKSLYATVYPKNKYDIYVICDNCTDDTAGAVRKAGAIAMERHDPDHRGKGYGLKWMFEYLEDQSQQGNEYDAYIVLDADNLVNEEYLYCINEKLNEGYEILQTYLGCKNPKDTWISGSYSYCYWVSNTIYQMAHSKVGLSAQMGGTGMIMRPSVLREIGWDTDSLTEDLVLTARYVKAKNLPCCWVHDARLYDEKPLKLIPSIRQRTRWMQGHMAAMCKFLPGLLFSSIRHLSLKQFDIAFYLSRPFLNIVMFVTYLFRIYFNIFMPETMAVDFIMSANASMLLIIAHFVLQFYILFCEQYARYIPLFILQFVFSFTWYPAIFRGLIKRNERYWMSTVHTRNISIKDVGEDARLQEAKERLKGLDNLHRLPLGQILLKATAISKTQLDEALKQQNEKGGFLGDIIIDMQILSKDMLSAYLQVQKLEKEVMEKEGRTDEHLRLGDMLVGSGLITERQLRVALEYQKSNGGLLGESLISTRCLPVDLLGMFLEVQKLLDANYVSPNRAKQLINGVLSNSTESIGVILWEGGLLSKQQLEYTLELQEKSGDKLGAILVNSGFINEETLNVILEMQKYGRAHKLKNEAEGVFIAVAGDTI